MEEISIEKNEENCKGELMYYHCPVCGLPIVEGQCPAGHDVEVKHLPLTSLADFLAPLDLQWHTIEILDKDEPYIPKDEQYVTLRILPIFEDALKKERETRISLYMDEELMNLHYVNMAIDEILVEYLYRKECKNPVEIVEKYYRNDPDIYRRSYTVMLTFSKARFLREAARYFGMGMGKLVESYVRMYMIEEEEYQKAVEEDMEEERDEKPLAVIKSKEDWVKFKKEHPELFKD